MKKKIPYLFRNKFSCPECGLIVTTEDVVIGENTKGVFNCVRCSVRLSWDEFLDDNQEKWSREADLSSELEENYFTKSTHPISHL